MLRLTEVKLPLDHPEGAIESAVLKKLAIPATQLRRCEIHRRSYDARKRSVISLIYTLDVEIDNEATVLKRLRGDKHVMPTPSMAYRFVAQAPANLRLRPLVIGAGPCGLLAALVLAQMGFRPRAAVPRSHHLMARGSLTQRKVLLLMLAKLQAGNCLPRYAKSTARSHPRGALLAK